MNAQGNALASAFIAEPGPLLETTTTQHASGAICGVLALFGSGVRQTNTNMEELVRPIPLQHFHQFRTRTFGTHGPKRVNGIFC
jgi:hypothetical protein